MDKCSIKYFDLPVDEGQNSIPIYVIRPGHLSNNQKLPVIIMAHGGSGITGSANAYMFLACRKAIDCNCVVLNVDYRVAPEYKFPIGIIDFYQAIKDVYYNSDYYGINKEKICICGYEAGCIIAMASAFILSKENEGYMVKGQFLVTPMISG